jgi:hypothetical protein
LLDTKETTGVYFREERLRGARCGRATHPDDARARGDIDRREVVADDAGERKEPHRVDRHEIAGSRFGNHHVLGFALGMRAGMASAGGRAD